MKFFYLLVIVDCFKLVAKNHPNLSFAVKLQLAHVCAVEMAWRMAEG
jgi:hypothetical protein